MRKKYYSKEIFIHTIETLIKYNWEPEVEIFLSNARKITIIAYREFIDYVNEDGECSQLSSIIDVLPLINWETIETISSLNGLDFSIPIESQTIVENGKLWIIA